MDLRVRLHGQHLAQEIVPRAVRDHLEQPGPRKALALSFHGGSGTGKNFVAGMLAERLFRAGLQSPCVQMLIATLHFPHTQYLDRYKVSLGEPCHRAGRGPWYPRGTLGPRRDAGT